MTTTFKRVLRPLIPDRLMARYRLGQHSKHSRVNVEVFVPDRREARRWLATTPDTYRVWLDLPGGQPPSDVVEVRDASFHVDEAVSHQAIKALAAPGVAAVIAADTRGPRLVDRTRAEPTIGPRLVVTTQDVVDEIGGVPPGEHPLPGLVARLRDAGHHLGLIPLPPGEAPTTRTDPINLFPIVIMSAVPMHDIGGGSRSAQLALEMVRQGFHVAYVAMYESQETVDLGLRFIHPNLEQYRVKQFDPESHAQRSSQAGLVLVEAPAQVLIEPAYALQTKGWELVYDVIDDWSDQALGGDWYRAGVEKLLIERANRLVASATDLVDRIAKFGRPATLVPNAVNREIFGVELPPRPPDLPEAEMILGYHGSLYGDWFDWDALKEVAEAFPHAAVLVIGDDKAPHPKMPDNVHFLGLKSQGDLPAYLQRFDVGLLPFKLTETTHAVSPLKVYEYLASGIPVAAPPLRSLAGLDGVWVNSSLVRAVNSARQGGRPDRLAAMAEHSWAERVRGLLDDQESGRAPGGVVVTARPTDHWLRRQRFVG